MGKTGAVYGILVLVVGAFVGWHARRAHSAHGDIKLVKTRVPAFRRVRLRSGLLTAILVILSLLAISALAR